MRPPRSRRRRGVTLIEALIFGSIGLLVLAAVLWLFVRGTRLFELGRLTSSAQADMRAVMENLSEDAAELVYLDRGKTIYNSTDSTSPGGSLSFVVRTSRVEPGLGGGAGQGVLRRIEYRLDGTGALRDCIRSVTPLNDAGQPAGNPSVRTLVRRGIRHLKVWSLAAVPGPGTRYRLRLASDTQAEQRGATVACMVVDLSLGEERGGSALDRQPITQLVTRIWCRNRVLEIARGALR